MSLVFDMVAHDIRIHRLLIWSGISKRPLF